MINLHIVSGLCLTEPPPREMDCDFCLAPERAFSRRVLKRRIDLFTSPSNTELVQLELELIEDLGVNRTKMKITSRLLLTLDG